MYDLLYILKIFIRLCIRIFDLDDVFPVIIVYDAVVLAYDEMIGRHFRNPHDSMSCEAC